MDIWNSTSAVSCVILIYNSRRCSRMYQWEFLSVDKYACMNPKRHKGILQVMEFQALSSLCVLTPVWASSSHFLNPQHFYVRGYGSVMVNSVEHNIMHRGNLSWNLLEWFSKREIANRYTRRLHALLSVCRAREEWHGETSILQSAHRSKPPSAINVSARRQRVVPSTLLHLSGAASLIHLLQLPSAQNNVQQRKRKERHTRAHLSLSPMAVCVRERERRESGKEIENIPSTYLFTALWAQ
jgi:hypothetical protein